MRWGFYLCEMRVTFDGHFDILEEGVHFDINSIDGSNDDGSIFELDGNSLIFKFHQEPNQFHWYIESIIIRVLLN